MNILQGVHCYTDIIYRHNTTVMKQAAIIGAIIIVVLGGIYLLFGRDDAMMNENGDNGTADESNTMGDESSPGANGAGGDRTTPANRVVLAENETGNFANIAQATLTESGFVVVYKVNSRGETTYLGNTDTLEAGTYSDLSVQLDTVVADEETIVAVLHADNGDGEFEAGSDAYLGNADMPVVSDVDVIDTAFENESVELQSQVEAYIEAEMENDVEVQ